MRNLILAIALAGLLCAPVIIEAKKRVTTRPRLERIVSEKVDTADTLAAVALDSIMLSGYDKPLRSRRESVFVTNNTSVRLTRLTLSIDYYDMEGRQLHHADVETGVDIPRGETRQVTFPSWDRQLTFVYHRSEKSRNARAVVYNIKASVVAARGREE